MPLDGATFWKSETYYLDPHEWVGEKPFPHVPFDPVITMPEVCRLVLEAHHKGILQATARAEGRYTDRATMERTTERARDWLEAVQWRLGIKPRYQTTFYCAAGYVQFSIGGRLDGIQAPTTLSQHIDQDVDFLKLCFQHDRIVECRHRKRAVKLLEPFIAAVEAVATGKTERFDALNKGFHLNF